MGEKRVFKEGDFIKRDNRKGSFMIYEGKNISDTCVKKLTVVCAYDPEKYMQTKCGYDHVPHLEVPMKGKPCSETIDTDKEDYWISLCTPTEKADAIQILEEYGYIWDEENLALVDMVTGEIIKRIVIPDNTYYGEIVRPITDDFKDILKKSCLEKSKPTYPTHSPSYQDWDDYGE